MELSINPQITVKYYHLQLPSEPGYPLAKKDKNTQAPH